VEQEIAIQNRAGAQPKAGRAHVIVIGNEKGGSGKTTTAMHITTALLMAGYSVGSLDLDIRQRSFTRYIENRKSWVGRRNITMPEHIVLQPLAINDTAQREELEKESFLHAMAHLSANHDFVVVDCPGSDSHLSRLGHAAADTLISPINESFVDFDLLAHVDPDSLAIKAPSIYAEMVWSCRKARAASDGASIDWVVIRNRTSHIHAKNRNRIEKALDELSHRLGFRQVSGLSERVVFREMFPAGITLLDLTDEEANASLTMSHVAARAEVRALLAALQLPDKAR
jgi:chromosome partitioning protein